MTGASRDEIWMFLRKYRNANYLNGRLNLQDKKGNLDKLTEAIMLLEKHPALTLSDLTQLVGYRITEEHLMVFSNFWMRNEFTRGNQPKDRKLSFLTPRKEQKYQQQFVHYDDIPNLNNLVYSWRYGEDDFPPEY